MWEQQRKSEGEREKGRISEPFWLFTRRVSSAQFTIHWAADLGLHLNTPNAGFNSPRTLHVKNVNVKTRNCCLVKRGRLDAKANSIRAACLHGQVAALNNFGVP